MRIIDGATIRTASLRSARSAVFRPERRVRAFGAVAVAASIVFLL
jgi:hypothetical protein